MYVWVVVVVVVMVIVVLEFLASGTTYAKPCDQREQRLIAHHFTALLLFLS